MTSSSSLYGSTTTTGTVASDNYTTLYSTGTGTVASNNLVVPGTLTVNGCAILTNCTTFNLLPTTATTVNFANAATTLNIGASGAQIQLGDWSFNSDGSTSFPYYTFPSADGLLGNTLVTDGAGNVTWQATTSVGKTYDITATTTTGGANFNLNSNVPTTDTIKFANGSNITVVATDASTITISATDTNTTYDFNASSTTGGVNLNLVGSDSTTDTVKLSNGTGVTVSYVSGTEASIAIGQNVATTATPTFGTTTLNGSLRINGATNGYSQFTAPATGSNLSYVLPGAAGAANTVLTNDGSGNLSWALPGGGGSTFGNITIAVVDDNTISTTTGDLKLDSATDLVNVQADLTVEGDALIINTSATTNNWLDVLSLRANSTGTPAVNFGAGLTFEVETAASVFKDAGYIKVSATDVGTGTEDFRMDFGLMEAGGAYSNKLKIDSTADMLVLGSATSSTPVGIGGAIAGSDFWHIGGYSIGGAGANDGALEIATANNGNEPIYVRQYTGASTTGNAWPFGNTIARTLTLLDASGNTSFPGNTVATRVIGNALDLRDSSTNNLRVSIDPNIQITTSSTGLQSIGNIDNAATYRTIKVLIQATSGTAYQSVEGLIVHDGTNAFINTYADVRTGANLTTTFDADISGGFIRLLVNPVNAITTYNVLVIALTV